MSGSKAKAKRKAKFPGLAAFIRTAINGQYEAREIDAVLELIEQGIGLDDRDRAIAEQFGVMPDDDHNPVFKRGWLEGHARGLLDAGHIPEPALEEPSEPGN